MSLISSILEVTNMDDIMSDFTHLKVSTLKKAAHISATMETECAIIRFKSTLNKNNVDKLENIDNIENEQNSCNIRTPQKTSNKSMNNMISTSSGIPFSFKKILLESELQRKEEVWKNIDRRVQHMKENDGAIQKQMENSRSLMARERERRSAEKLADILAEGERIAEQEEIKKRHEQQLHAQRAQEQKEKHEREVEEYRKRMKEKEELKKTVMAHRDQLATKFGDIALLSKACKDKFALNVVFTANTEKIKELAQQMEILNEKITNGDLVSSDISIVETLVCHMNDILNTFRMEIEKIDAQYEAEIIRKAQIANKPEGETKNLLVGDVVPSQQPHEINIVENNENKEQSSNIITNQGTTAVIVNEPILSSASNSKLEAIGSSQCKIGNLLKYVDKESLEIYIKSRHFLDLYRDTHKDFLQSVATKKFRFECQKAINIPVNAISGVSKQHLRDKYDRLQNLLTGKSSLNVMQYPQGVTFCKDHLAKQIVSQGETLISSKPEMAFPVAMIIVALWNEHADFGEMVLAHLHEACPFTVPIFLPQQEDQSDEDYYKFLGCKYSEDGTVEQQDKFLKRMSGFVRLYASITITPQRRNITKPHPHGLEHAWRWFAAVLNIESRIDTCGLCATLILDMLEVVGNVLWTAYPTQFHKLLTLLLEKYYPCVRDIANGSNSGPLMRLEEFLSNALANGTIRPPSGMLPSDFL